MHRDISRAASSVGVMYHFSGPNTGSNPGGGWIIKKKKKNEHILLSKLYMKGCKQKEKERNVIEKGQ